MYRFAGLGAAGCTVPSECVQAAKYYPQHINVSLVDDYCVWAAQGKGGQVEVLCLEAIMKGQGSGKPGCEHDADCENGICEDGTCEPLPVSLAEPGINPLFLAIGLGALGGAIYHWRRGAG